LSFYFPRQNLYITVPYKNGATSALNFFVSVEKYLESNNCLIKDLDHLDGLTINQDFGVHAKSGQYSAEPFRALATRANHDKADIRFFIIRDPYKRFSSFWHNRIMNGPDPYFAKIHNKLSAKFDLHDSQDVQLAAIEFLNDLAKPFSKPITNGHLWPQIYLTKGKQYDLIVETEDLVNLPSILANMSENFRAFQSLSLPRLNISANSEFPLLWNQEMKEIFKKNYAADLALFEGFKSGNFGTNIEITKLIEISRQKMKLYDNCLILARDFLKSRSS
jgi:hypothetical protein